METWGSLEEDPKLRGHSVDFLDIQPHKGYRTYGLSGVGIPIWVEFEGLETRGDFSGMTKVTCG